MGFVTNKTLFMMGKNKIIKILRPNSTNINVCSNIKSINITPVTTDTVIFSSSVKKLLLQTIIFPNHHI